MNVCETLHNLGMVCVGLKGKNKMFLEYFILNACEGYLREDYEN